VAAWERNTKLWSFPAQTGIIAAPMTYTIDGDLYGRYGAMCHGDAAISGALNPDLRHSGVIASAEALKAIVIGGQLHQNGMVSFKAVLKPADAEAIRMYIIKRANEDKQLAAR
jgi:alcohol dehydrogenase (cytochrome c)/quinohemoprotein ethanol dehydrogenase